MLKRTLTLFFVSLIFLLPGWVVISCKKASQGRIDQVQATSIQQLAEPTNNVEQKTIDPRPTNLQPQPTISTTSKTIISLQNKQQIKEIENKNLREKKDLTNTVEPFISQDNELFSSFNSTGVLFPEDFRMGPVLNTYKMRSDQSKINSQVNVFFNSLIKKEIKKELIEKHRRDLLIISLDYYLQSNLNIKDFRLGTVQIDNQDCNIRVRLFSDKTTSNGFIYLTKEGDNWLITDVQINFLELGEQNIKQQEKFQPSVWSDYDY